MSHKPGDQLVTSLLSKQLPKHHEGATEHVRQLLQTGTISTRAFGQQLAAQMLVSSAHPILRNHP